MTILYVNMDVQMIYNKEVFNIKIIINNMVVKLNYYFMNM